MAEQAELAAHRRWYAGVVARVRETVSASVPEHARVAVISKGDDQLLDLGDREAWHFPQTETGLFAGFHPADGADAVAHLERARGRGAEFLVIPASALWWLDHYTELRAHLDEQCALVADVADACRIYALGGGPAGLGAARPAADVGIAGVAPPVSAWLDALLPGEAGVVAVGPAAPALHLADRPVWRIPEPDAGQLEAAVAAGAAYAVVLTPPGRRARAQMEPLRRAAGRHGRLVGAQALAEVFEVRGGVQAPRRRRTLLQLFRDPLRRPDAAT
jgi:hypothetical protein